MEAETPLSSLLDTMPLWSRKPKLRRCLVPEGTFEMGSATSSFDEGPVHSVYVSAFEMSLFPVLNEEYAVYVRKTGAAPPRWWREAAFRDPKKPVVGVNWHEAGSYCAWLSEQTGLNIRLPTEAEFEKAARGGRLGTVYPWGNSREESGYRWKSGPLEGPYRSGENPANGFGLHDTVSNVFQWCLDGYDPDYYAQSSSRNPRGAEGAAMRSARGASWTQEDLLGRCAARASLAPYFRVHDFGFRWVIAYDSGF